MSKETLKVLELVAEGKISPEEGERLIKALGQANSSSRSRGFGPQLPDLPEINIPKIDLGQLGEMCVEMKNKVIEGTKEAQGKFRKSKAAKYLEFKDYPVAVEMPEGAESCQLNLDIRAGRMKLKGNESTGKLLSGKAKRVPEEPQITVESNDKTADVKVRNSLGRMSLRANPDLNYNIAISNAAAETRLDLEALKVEELTLDNNAGNMLVDLSELAKRVEIEANNNAGNLRLRMPAGHALRIAMSGNLSNNNLARYGLEFIDGVATSEDWEENECGVDMVLSQNVASFKLDWQRKITEAAKNEEQDTREVTIEVESHDDEDDDF